MEAVQDHAEKFHPKVAARLQAVSSACSDFTSGCQKGYMEVHGAKYTDEYRCDHGVWVARCKCVLTGCEEHALDNLCGGGKTGISKLKRRGDLKKTDIASTLRARLYQAHRRFEIVLFDIFAFYTLRDVQSGVIPYVGVQARWAKYFEAWYLFEEPVGGVPLYNAIWRSGPDRCKSRSSNNCGESYHAKVQAKVQNVVKGMVNGISSNPRPSFPEFLNRFETAFDIDEELRPETVNEMVHRWPVGVDPNILNGHKSIVAHSQRLSVKEYLSENRRGDGEYFYTEDHGPWRYWVMSAACSKESRHAPNKVDAKEAALFISLLRLGPSEDRHEGFLTANGIIVEGRLSWSRFFAFWVKYSVVRVDMRLKDSCKEAPHLWQQAVVDLTACDEWLNGQQCEHQLVARCFEGDPMANPLSNGPDPLRHACAAAPRGASVETRPRRKGERGSGDRAQRASIRARERAGGGRWEVGQGQVTGGGSGRGRARRGSNGGRQSSNGTCHLPCGRRGSADLQLSRLHRPWMGGQGRRSSGCSATAGRPRTQPRRKSRHRRQRRPAGRDQPALRVGVRRETAKQRRRPQQGRRSITPCTRSCSVCGVSQKTSV